jgi:hypothetical protein
MRIVELRHLLVDFDDKTPLTPKNEAVEPVDDPDFEDGEYHDIGMGILVDAKEKGKSVVDSKSVNNDTDLDEFTLISNCVSELADEEPHAESGNGALCSCLVIEIP